MREVQPAASGPGASGPYSPAVRIGDQVFIAGQLGLAEDGSMPEDFASQMALMLDNFRAALASAGCQESDVGQVTVYLTRREDLPEFNRLYAECFSEPYPARTLVQAGLRPGALVELDARAVRPAGRAERTTS